LIPPGSTLADGVMAEHVELIDVTQFADLLDRLVEALTADG
jgi:hypothetical protein